MNNSLLQKTLIVLLGPTGVGKTDSSLAIAQTFGTSIISCDSRQIFREMHIGTAAPEEDLTRQIPHYFVKTKSVEEYYSAGQFELDALRVLDELFVQNPIQLMVGGSMLYIDALCRGLDDIPHTTDEIRSLVKQIYEMEGIEGLQRRLAILDPVHYEQVDRHNTQRMLHAVELCLQTGRPYSDLLGKRQTLRSFEIVKIGLDLPREELYERINNRVDKMMSQGLLEEAKRLYPQRHLNALNTVGYKELFRYFDGEWSLDFAVQMIKQNSRRYAKRQLTWFRRDDSIRWFSPFEIPEIIEYIKQTIKK